MVKIYGSMLCEDCVACVEELCQAKVEFKFCDFADELLYLKEFLKIRDGNPLFDDIRDAGKIGIPCICREDGSVTLDWRELLLKHSCTPGQSPGS